MKDNILIVEDEPSIVTLIQYNLKQAGFETNVALNGIEAIAMIRKYNYDLIVLDLMLPKLDGINVCKIIRQEQNKVPIIMLTAKDSEYDKIHGLELGADDYVTKPFSPKELIVRIKAILKRTKDYENPNEMYKIGQLEIYPDRFEVYFKGEVLDLKKKEFELLLFLMKHKGQTFTRDTLLKEVWNFSFVGDTRVVDVQISNLRDKIESDTKKPNYIKTVRGLGYKLEAPE